MLVRIALFPIIILYYGNSFAQDFNSLGSNVSKITFRNSTAPRPGEQSGFGPGLVWEVRFTKPLIAGSLLHLVVYDKQNRVIEFDTALYINAPRIQSKNSSSRTYFPFPLIDEVSRFTVSQKMSGDYSTAILNISCGYLRLRERLVKGQCYFTEVYLNGKRIFKDEVELHGPDDFCCKCNSLDK
jgi:hypothetical protein